MTEFKYVLYVVKNFHPSIFLFLISWQALCKIVSYADFFFLFLLEFWDLNPDLNATFFISAGNHGFINLLQKGRLLGKNLSNMNAEVVILEAG